MPSFFGLTLLFACSLFLNSCNDSEEKIILKYYYSPSDSNIYLGIRVTDSLELDIPNTLVGFDSVSVFFPSSRKELPCSRADGFTYYFGIKQIDRVFNQNDSIQILFKKKNQVIYRPTLYKYTDTIIPGGGGMVKLC